MNTTLFRERIAKLFGTKPEGIILELFNSTDRCWKNTDFKLYNILEETRCTQYRVRWHDVILAHFHLSQLVWCCGICVSTGAYVYEEYRNKGLGSLLNELRQHIATELGYGLLLCTDKLSNTAQRKVLAKNNWQDVYTFTNPRTGNELVISVKEL